jgi:hypothetical protein
MDRDIFMTLCWYDLTFTYTVYRLTDTYLTEDIKIQDEYEKKYRLILNSGAEFYRPRDTKYS